MPSIHVSRTRPPAARMRVAAARRRAAHAGSPSSSASERLGGRAEPGVERHRILFPDRPEDPEVVGTGQVRRDRAVGTHPHQGEHDVLHGRRDLERVAPVRPHHAPERLDGRPGDVRGRQTLLHLGPRHLAAERSDAPVDEVDPGERSRAPDRGLERDHRSPRMPGDHHRATSDARRSRDGGQVSRRRREAVPGGRLRAPAVATRVERDDAEPTGEAGQHEVPDVLRRREAVVHDQGAARVVGTVHDAGREPHAALARHLAPALVHTCGPW